LAQPDLAVFGSLQRDVDRLFDEFARGFGSMAMIGNGKLVPSMDVSETDKEFVITTELPGLKREDVEISLDDNVLTIRGEKKMEPAPDNADKGKGNDQSKNKDANVHVSERSYGIFYRALELPFNVDPGSVQATMSNGVLKIQIPKPARHETQRIEVKQAA
jgi:HSP20 family protein